MDLNQIRDTIASGELKTPAQELTEEELAKLMEENPEDFVPHGVDLGALREAVKRLEEPEDQAPAEPENK